jgi:hypothetical protein
MVPSFHACKFTLLVLRTTSGFQFVKKWGKR